MFTIMSVNNVTASHKIVCNCSGSAPTKTTATTDLSSNGGLIAMAAGLSVVIPLICVIVMQLRRAKAAERQRLVADAQARETRRRDQRRDLPPEYEEVFGTNRNYPSGTPSNNRTTNSSREERDLVRPGNGTRDNESESKLKRFLRGLHLLRSTSIREDNVLRESNQIYQPGTISTPPNASASISFISDNQIADISSSSHSLHYQTNETINPSDSPATIATERFDDHNHLTSNQSSSIELSTSSSSISTHSSVPAPNISHNAVLTSTHIAVPPQMTTAHPGMHISPFEYLDPSSGLPNNEDTIPPPSYEEALEIIKSAAHEADKEAIISG